MKTTLSKADILQVRKTQLATVLKKVASGKTLTGSEERLLKESQAGGFIGTVETLGQASKAMGVSVTILKAAKRAGAPGFRKNSIRCDDVKAWLDLNPVDLSAHMSAMEKQKFRKLKAEADAKEFANAVKRKEYFLADDVRTQWTRIITTARSILAGKSSGLAMVLASFTGADAVEIETRIKAMVKEFIVEMHANPAAVKSVKCGKCGEEVAI